MEMHTRKSLREIHGVEMRPVIVSSRRHKQNYNDYAVIAMRWRDRFVAQLIVEAGRKAVTLGRQWYYAIKQEVRFRTAERELHTMTGHQLQDIGVGRHQISDAVRYGRTSIFEL